MDREFPILTAVLTAVAVIIGIGVVVAIVEDDEPTQVEAEEQFCDDAGAFAASMGALRDADDDTSLDEFEELRENARIAYENMIRSLETLRYARLEEIEEANDEFRAAVDDIDDEGTLGEALESIEDELEELSIELSQVMNDVDCGSGQGAQERSDE
jgi:hypothetical protein